MSVFIICGHGAGDPGAVGNGYQEAEMVRALADRIKCFGGKDVIVGDTSKNWYKSNMLNNGNVPKGSKVIELHMDSGVETARGGHIIIDADFEPDKYDNALADFIGNILPGRSNKIVKRNDLANPNRAQANGINYRLIECGFISNAEDVQIFNSRMDEIAKGILACFGVSAGKTEKKEEVAKTLDDWAREVINGKHGSGHVNRANSLSTYGCPYSYEQVRTRVNEMCGVKNAQNISSGKTLDDWAKEVVAGKHGIGHTNREKSLIASGCKFAYSVVRSRVNELCK